MRLIILFFISLIFLFKENLANEFKLICENKKQVNNIKLSNRFSKIINFNNKTVENISGNYFDKILIFNKYELIMHNNIFQTTSSFNLINGEWTVYNEKFIDIYSCKKKGVNQKLTP